MSNHQHCRSPRSLADRTVRTAWQIACRSFLPPTQLAHGSRRNGRSGRSCRHYCLTRSMACEVLDRTAVISPLPSDSQFGTATAIPTGRRLNSCAACAARSGSRLIRCLRRKAEVHASLPLAIRRATFERLRRRFPCDERFASCVVLCRFAKGFLGTSEF